MRFCDKTMRTKEKETFIKEMKDDSKKTGLFTNFAVTGK